MAVWYWTYELQPIRALSALAGTSPRRGALIRVGSGFADVHPWPELGDPPLEKQLEMLARYELTTLTRRSLHFAELDGKARERGVSLFDGLTIPPSHWPLGVPASAPAGPAAPHAAVPAGFDTVKLKMSRGTEIPSELAAYGLRLDFNATLDADAFIEFADSLSAEIRESIDFVEDPCPYDADAWRRIRERTGFRLALDRGDATEAVDVLVVKPAVQDFPENVATEIVVTSYMDHPLGQLGAAYVAARNSDRVSPRCGLMTHLLYKRDPFMEQMRNDGPILIPPAGTGFGFDQLLESLPWKRLG